MGLGRRARAAEDASTEKEGGGVEGGGGDGVEVNDDADDADDENSFGSPGGLSSEAAIARTPEERIPLTSLRVEEEEEGNEERASRTPLTKAFRARAIERAK